jgi:hypothetical protein
VIVGGSRRRNRLEDHCLKTAWLALIGPKE